MNEVSNTTETADVRMMHTIPSLPVSDMEHSVEFYCDMLGFTLAHQADGFAIIQRDAAEIHLWAATDDDWRTSDDSWLVASGAESFIAGTASCRVGVEGVDELHQTLQPHEILHPNAPLHDTDYGTREFTVCDPDGNAIAFFERIQNHVSS